MGKPETWKQRQERVLLRFPNSPVALKASAALRWRVRMLPEVYWNDRDVTAFTLGKNFSEKVCLPQRSGLYEDVMECSIKD